MRFQTRLIFVFLSLLVILPAFLLNTQPALAFVSHIVRLKDSDGNPIVGRPVYFASGEFNAGWAGGTSWEHDCSHDLPGYLAGEAWNKTTDDKGIVVFSALDINNSDNTTPIMECSSNYNMPMIVALPNLPFSGYWHLDSIHGSNSVSAYLMTDSSSVSTLWSRLSDDQECSNDDGHQGYRGNDCDSGWPHWSSTAYGSGNANLARISIAESGGPCSIGGGFNCGGKPFNIYWEWTWVETGHGHSQNIQNQPFLALANNLWSSFLNIFPKKLI